MLYINDISSPYRGSYLNSDRSDESRYSAIALVSGREVSVLVALRIAKFLDAQKT